MFCVVAAEVHHSPWESPLQSDSAHSATVGKNLSEPQMQVVSLAEQPVAAIPLVMQMAWGTGQSLYTSHAGLVCTH